MKHANLLRKIDVLCSYDNFKALVNSTNRLNAQGKTYANYSLTSKGVLFLLLNLTEHRYKKFQIQLINTLPDDDHLCVSTLLDNILNTIENSDIKHIPVSVYIITDGDKVKIGRSKDVVCRVAQLQTSNPKKLYVKADILIGSNEEASSFERFIHNILDGFSPDHCSEWFDISFDACISFLLRASVRSKRVSKNKWFLETFLKYHDKNYNDIFSAVHKARFTGKNTGTITYEDEPEPCYTVTTSYGDILDICYTYKEALNICNVLGLQVV